MVSQGRAAEIVALSRAEFIDMLGRYGITPFQYDSADELQAEVEMLRLRDQVRQETLSRQEEKRAA